MISLSRIYSQRAVYLLFLSLFTLLWELVLAAKAYAEPRGPYLPTGPCVPPSSAPCQQSIAILHGILDRQTERVNQMADTYYGREAINNVTFGALIIMRRMSFTPLLRRHLIRPGTTHIAFVLNGKFQRRAGRRVDVPGLRSIGIDPKQPNAYIPDAFIAILMQDSEAFRQLVVEFEIRPERLRDAAGNGLPHYIARFATDEFLDAISDLIPRAGDKSQMNDSGMTASDVLRTREQTLVSDVQTDHSAVNEWLDHYAEQANSPFQLALAQ